jgi:alkylhydroperoxidase/carboxymuconolactone decarboxylase family protein YurZ
MSVSDDLFDQGERIRRQVLGDEHVDRSLANASEFGRPLQELVTAFCWGATWGRPGLELKTRSLLNLAMLTALDRQTELAVIEAFRTAESVLGPAAANGHAPGRAGADGAGAEA